MKHIFCLLAIIICLASRTYSQNQFFTTSYISLTVPQIFHGSLSYVSPTTATSSQQNVDALKHDTSLLVSFPLVISAVTIYQNDVSGNLSLTSNSISAKNENYTVIYDFTQTQQLTLSNDTGNSVVSGLIGISVRMTAQIHTRQRGIDLGNLFGIGLNASQNKLSGSLQVEAFGMSSQEINALIPMPSELSAGTIQTALSAVATIKSHIYDANTTITPLWLAFNITTTYKSSIDFKKVSHAIQTYK